MTAAQLKAAATGAASPEQARNPYDALKRQLESSKVEFLPLLGTPGNVDRFIRVVLNAVLATPDLLNANRRTLISACMRAAQDGLMPDGREAVLNIYNTKVSKRGEPDRWEKAAQYLPMVGGLVKKLYDSGEVTYIDAACVYQADRFTFKRGEDPKLEHEPTMDSDPGPVVAAYCVVKLKNGEIKREVMPRRDIDKVRGASKSGDKGPWADWFDQQAIKSVIKRIYKQMPKADAFERVMESDNLASGFAAMGSTVGAEIHPHPAAAAAPALEHQQSEQMDFSVPAGGDEQMEPVSAAAAPAAANAAQAEGEAPTGTQGARKGRQQAAAAQQQAPKFDPVAAIKKIEQCNDREILALVADEFRDIPDSLEKSAVLAAYTKRDAELEAGDGSAG